MSDIIVRKAMLRDAPGIARLVNHYAERRFMLPRSLGQVCESLRDFLIVEEGGEVVGCCALHLWGELAEIRSLAVAESHWRKGLGSAMVRRCLEEAREMGVQTIFTLTYQPEFFERFGYARVSKDRFPQKIWSDCANCPQFPNCSEVALVYELGDADR